jgi:hypothetical protein
MGLHFWHQTNLNIKFINKNYIFLFHFVKIKPFPNNKGLVRHKKINTFGRFSFISVQKKLTKGAKGKNTDDDIGKPLRKPSQPRRE